MNKKLIKTKQMTTDKKAKAVGAFLIACGRLDTDVSGYSFVSGFVFHKTCTKVVLQAVASTNIDTKNRTFFLFFF